MRASRAPVACPKGRPFESYGYIVCAPVHCVWLRALKASSRKFAVTDSRILKFLAKDKSILLSPGPRTVPSPELPLTPIGGAVNAAVLKSLEKLLLPWLRFGLPDTNSSSGPAKSNADVPPLSGPPLLTVKALPDSNVAIPDNRQPVNTALDQDAQPAPYTGLQIPLNTKRCRCDSDDSPRS